LLISQNSVDDLLVSNSIDSMKNTYLLPIYLLALVVAVATSDVDAQGRRSERIGEVLAVQPIAHGVELRLQNAHARILRYGEETVRVTVQREPVPETFSYAVVTRPQGEFASVHDTPDQLVLTTAKLKVVVHKRPFRMEYFTRDGALLQADDPGFAISWIGNEVTNYKQLQDGERFIGLGEKTGPLDRRGNAYVNWNTDDYGYEPGADPLYASTPFYMGLHRQRMYGVFLDNTHKTVFNFGASNNRFSFFSADDGPLDYYFFGAQTIPGILDAYTQLTGRPYMPPLWSLGFQQCRWSYYPDTEVLHLARTFREKQIPADVIYLDIHYMDAYKIFTWHPQFFPNPKKLLDELNAMGFKVVVIVDPGIKIEKGYTSYESGLTGDHFVKYPDGSLHAGEVWPGWCHFPDFTQPQTRAWWGDSFKDYVSVGLEGFWNDMNEPASWGNRFPDLVEFSMEGRMGSHKEVHNIYGLQMARATYEGARKWMGNKRPFNLTRAAYSGIQRYSAVWTGDNVASDEHMLTGVRMVSSMGLAGMPFAGPDVGGFSGTPTPELFTRWLTIGAFTPFFRNHTEQNSPDQEPWAFGEWHEEISKKYISLRYRLLPYIYSAFYETHRSGMPIARSMAIYHPFDPLIYTWDFHNQYYFGGSLLVAPVESTQKFAKVYLPEGKWYRMDSDEVLEGGREHLVEAPLDRLPVFVKGGSFLPMQSVVQHTSQKPEEVLELHVYYGSASGEFHYYEDDGSTFAFEEGAYFSRKMEFLPQSRTLRLAKPEGTYPTYFKKLRLVLHGFDEVKTLTSGKSRMPIQWNGKLGVLEIEMPLNETVFKW
jgi:alpha-glucosidase